jgi:hypothetical protein
VACNGCDGPAVDPAWQCWRSLPRRHSRAHYMTATPAIDGMGNPPEAHYPNRSRPIAATYR